MRKLINFSVLIFLLLAFASSCSQDDSQPFENPNSDVITVDSELGVMLNRISDRNRTSSIDCIRLFLSTTRVTQTEEATLALTFYPSHTPNGGDRGQFLIR